MFTLLISAAAVFNQRLSTYRLSTYLLWMLCKCDHAISLLLWPTHQLLSVWVKKQQHPNHSQFGILCWKGLSAQMLRIEAILNALHCSRLPMDIYSQLRCYSGFGVGRPLHHDMCHDMWGPCCQPSWHFLCGAAAKDRYLPFIMLPHIFTQFRSRVCCIKWGCASCLIPTGMSSQLCEVLTVNVWC